MLHSLAYDIWEEVYYWKSKRRNNIEKKKNKESAPSLDSSESNSFIKSVGRQNIKEKPKRKSSTITVAFTQTDLEILTLYSNPMQA